MSATEETHGGMLNVRQIAVALSVHPRTVYTLIWSGRLPAVRVGGSWRIDRENLERWLAENTNTERR